MTWQPISTAPTTDRCPTEGCGGILLRLSNRKGICARCQGIYERPKIVHKHKTEKDWEPEELKKIIDVGLKDDKFKQLAVRTLFVLDLRRAELVGGDDARVPKEQLNPGLRWENVRDDGIWIKRKMHQDMEYKKNPELVKQWKEFFGPRRVDPKTGFFIPGKIFERSTDWVRRTLQTGAKKAGFEDWNMIHPHSVRHTMTTWVTRKHGVIVGRDTAGHKNLATTNTYVAKTPSAKLQEVSQEALAIV